MSTPLPHGLIQVVSATRTEPPSDPAEVIYERKKALHNFWKVHDAQCRVSRDPTDIRCRQLFWRVWSDRKLSLSLSQDVMLQLWMQCQRNYELRPFELRITHSSYSKEMSDKSRRKESVASDCSNETDTISPSQLPPIDEGNHEDIGESFMPDRRSQQSKTTTRSPELRSPGILRTSSGGESSRKRVSASSTATKAKSRPSITRKRSSQTTPNADPNKPRRPIIKSPRASSENQNSDYAIQSPQSNLVERTLTSPTDVLDREHKISAFELPSASSWMSVESHAPREKSDLQHNGPDTDTLRIDGNFRERFVEVQKVLKSSTNLEAMNRSLRKTGSVVRFADDVDVPAELRRAKAASKSKESSTSKGTSGLMIASEGHNTRQPDQNQVESWRPSKIQRHDSVGSVAAFSEDSEDEVVMMLPRTGSQLSLGIANLKRSQSQGENDQGRDTDVAVASPDNEQEVDPLTIGPIGRKRNEEEVKLLAMGRKDGVTRAGGVNLPKELTVKGPRGPGDAFEEPEQPLFG